MGEKGARQSDRAAETARGLVEDLAPLGRVTSKKMFGGFGIFEDGLMFALVDSEGSPFLRLDASNEERYEDRYGRMPYGRSPEQSSPTISSCSPGQQKRCKRPGQPGSASHSLASTLPLTPSRRREGETMSDRAGKSVADVEEHVDDLPAVGRLGKVQVVQILR